MLLTVPTRPAFDAMKADAWRDRRAARDLFDLATLADQGAIDAGAADLLRRVTGVGLATADLETLPADVEWRTQLGHQCRLEIEAADALRKVRDAWPRLPRV